MQDNQFDVVIVGGGMVGAALACGLTQQHFRVAVIERAEPAPFEADSDPDLRISAIGSSSVALLKQLNVWPRVDAMRSAPYRRLETWEWQAAQVSFDAASLGLPELGFMVENSVLQRALWEEMQSLGVTCYCPATLENLQPENGGWRVDLNDGVALHTRLVVGADGANSQVRQMAGIGIHGWSYAQSCLLISVTCEHPAGDATWQHFTPQGPRAFLPLYGNRASLVWYDAPARVRSCRRCRWPSWKKRLPATSRRGWDVSKPMRQGVFRWCVAMLHAMSCQDWRWLAMPRIPLTRWPGRA